MHAIHTQFDAFDTAKELWEFLVIRFNALVLLIAISYKPLLLVLIRKLGNL